MLQINSPNKNISGKFFENWCIGLLTKSICRLAESKVSSSFSHRMHQLPVRTPLNSFKNSASKFDFQHSTTWLPPNEASLYEYSPSLYAHCHSHRPQSGSETRPTQRILIMSGPKIEDEITVPLRMLSSKVSRTPDKLKPALHESHLIRPKQHDSAIMYCSSSPHIGTRMQPSLLY